ncbi:hypothetical protein [Moorena sp. SIO4E2]|uniref:hypothetical protein n=1 Tax=Moorena sp. SIO4E2 TaxID=2607826 RepID=UPI00257C7ED1|nr:hypothetical protein [Moorena sp. SIO4E2]
MKSRWLITSLLMVLMSCSPSPTPSTKKTPVSQPMPSPPNLEDTSKSGSSKSTTKLSPPASDAFTISAKGIGPAKLGMTLGQLKQSLGDKAKFEVKSPFIVDFDAIAVIQSGQPQYYILYPMGTPMGNSTVMEALFTTNPNYRTTKGVGPGTPLKLAEQTYGDATLSFNYASESREYVNFANLSEDIAFRMGVAVNDTNNQFSGLYASPLKEYNQTQNYRDSATIKSLEVYCRDKCPSR